MGVKRAIISVSDKAGVVDFAKGLSNLGVEIISTGGTTKILRENGIDVVDIAKYTGSPEILDGRLKTLHPMVHGGILGIRDNPRHQKEMAENGIKPIDMIVVNLYPFEETAARPGCNLAEAVENIDIGGPAMLRAAAKNYKDVAVIVDPTDYGWILDELSASGGSLKEETKFELAQKVFAHTARYDSAICNYLNAVKGGEKRDIFPSYIGFTYEKAADLRYGENPHQKAAFYKEYKIHEPCVAEIEQLHGKELSYNNIMDTDAAIELVKEFNGQIFVAIVKHTNPCGAAVSKKSLADAFNKARAVDPASSFGGIIGMNKKVDAETALAIDETFFEVIVAPDFETRALEILKKKKNVRLLKLVGLGSPSTPSGWNTRKVVGGLLVQERDAISIDIRKCDVPTKRRPTDEEYAALDFAWKICKHVKSNAIIYSSGDQLLGVGAGQMSRIDSAEFAAIKMGKMLKETNAPSRQATKTIVMASDAFFPFRDCVDVAAKIGVSAIIQPGGSVRDEESILAADEHDIAMVMTGIRRFRH